jgi:hypothetical protein
LKIPVRTLFQISLSLVLFALPVTAQEILVNRAYSTVPGDPNRDPNWDWTVDQTYTLYLDSGAVTVRLPYYSGSGPAAADLNISTGRDILPVDGWVLVVRHFGTPTSSVNFPYFILYNKYRGILRLFYWSPLTTPVTRAVGKMYFQQSSNTAALMTFSGPEPEYVNAYDTDKAQIVVGMLEPRQWGYLDFDVSGYDPNLAGKTDPTLVMTIYGVHDSQIVLEGSIQGTITADPGLTAHKPDTANNLKNIVDGVIAFYEKPAQYHKRIADAQQKFNTMADANADTWWGKYLKKIANLGASQWVRALGPVAGFIEAVKAFGSSSSSAPTPLFLNAEVRLEGGITEETQFYTILLRVPGSIHADPTGDTSSNILPLYDRPLGIFNLLAAPTVELTYVDSYYECSDWGWTYTESCIAEVDQRLAQLDYVVNPDSGLAVESFDAAYIPSNGGLPDFYVEGGADGYRPVCELMGQVVRSFNYDCPPYYVPQCGYPPPLFYVSRDIGVRVSLRVAASPSVVPTLLIRKYKPRNGAAGASSTCQSGSSSANPFRYATTTDQYRACMGIAGRASANCTGISDLNDRQMCHGLATSTQTPCTSMTDRNLQLACYGMAFAPNYPSNCRDITDAGLRDFCYSVSSWGSWANCSGVSNPPDKALCQAMMNRNGGFCTTIGNANDRAFCYGVSTRNSSYCSSIPH